MKGLILCAFSRLSASSNDDIHAMGVYIRESLVRRQPVYLLSHPDESEYNAVFGQYYGYMIHIPVPCIWDNGALVGISTNLQLLDAKKRCLDARIQEVKLLEIRLPSRASEIRALFENGSQMREQYTWSPFDRTVVNPRCIDMDDNTCWRVLASRISVIEYASKDKQGHSLQKQPECQPDPKGSKVLGLTH